jgi:hypothetical protein
MRQKLWNGSRDRYTENSVKAKIAARFLPVKKHRFFGWLFIFAYAMKVEVTIFLED